MVVRIEERFKPRCCRRRRCRCRRCRCRRCRCPSVCNEFLCGKYDILSGVWLSASCVCNEFLCITRLTVWQYVLIWLFLHEYYMNSTVRLTSIYYRVSGNWESLIVLTETIVMQVKKIIIPTWGIVWWSLLAEIWLIVVYLRKSTFT